MDSIDDDDEDVLLNVTDADLSSDCFDDPEIGNLLIRIASMKSDQENIYEDEISTPGALLSHRSDAFSLCYNKSDASLFQLNCDLL